MGYTWCCFAAPSTSSSTVFRYVYYLRPAPQNIVPVSERPSSLQVHCTNSTIGVCIAPFVSSLLNWLRARCGRHLQRLVFVRRPRRSLVAESTVTFQSRKKSQVFVRFLLREVCTAPRCDEPCVPIAFSSGVRGRFSC